MSEAGRTRSTHRVVLGLVAGLVLVGATALPGNAYIRPGKTIRVNVSSNGDQAVWAGPDLANAFDLVVRGFNAYSAVSGNGRYVGFTSYAPNLVPNYVPDGGPDVYVHDAKTGSTRLATESYDGTPQLWPLLGQGDCFAPLCAAQRFNGISDDGRFVLFTSNSLNLVPGDTNYAEDVFVHDMRQGATERVSVSSTGDETDGDSSLGNSISANGRYVSFQSEAENLVRNDANDLSDIFVHDRITNKTEIVSVSSQEVQGDGPSGGGGIAGGSGLSATGRYVAFQSNAENLVPEDDSQGDDVFLRDRAKGTTEVVSVALDGTTNGGQLYSGYRAVSPDGRFIIFTGGGYVPNDDLLTDDAFMRDMRSGRTVRVSVRSDGTTDQSSPVPNSRSSGGALSLTPDGRFVLVQGKGLASDDRPDPDCQSTTATYPVRIYVHDNLTGATEMVSRSSDGSQPAETLPGDIHNGCPWATYPSISNDGQRVTFQSDATNLVEDDTNKMVDVFLRLVGPALGVGGLGDEDPGQSGGGGDPAGLCITPDICIPPGGALASHDELADVDDALTRQGANLYGASLAYRPLYGDLFARIELEHMPIVTGAPAGGILYGLDFSVDGVDYQVRVQRVPGPDYVEHGGASFGLFTQDPLTGIYTKMAALRGGYGTTGEEVVFSLPLDLVGLENGGELADIEAFTAQGAYYVGAALVLDSLELPAPERD